MIGLMIGGSERFDLSFYHQLDYGKTVLETTIQNCLDSALIQRVIVAVPLTEQKKIQDLNKKGRFGRSATVHFYEDKEDKGGVDIAFEVAMRYSFDHLVKVNMNQVLLPGWEINRVVTEFMDAGANDFYKVDNSEGFELECMPYWKLANEYVNSEKRCIDPLSGWKKIDSKGLNYSSQFSFTVSKAEEFNSILKTVELGYDVDQVIEDFLDGGKQKNSE